MQLKRWDAVEWLELPRIEHPTHACYLLERLINVNGFGVNRVQGLPEVLWSDTQWTRNGTLDEHGRSMLMRRVANGEVFLIHGIGLEPAFPLLRRGTGAESDKWQVADDTLDHLVRDKVDWMLSRAAQTKLRGVLTIPPKQHESEVVPVKNEAPGVNWLGVDFLVRGNADRGALPLSGNVVAIDDFSKTKPRETVLTRSSNLIFGGDVTTGYNRLPAKQSLLALRHGKLLIPLGFDKVDTSQQKPTSAVEHTLLAPLLLRRYTSAERRTGEGAGLLAGSYVYIFLDGHLWRELKAIGDNKLQDVDLGNKERTPAGNELSQIIIPLKIGGRTPKVEIALAPVQWSWNRILAFGGLHDRDPRNKHTNVSNVEKLDDAKRAARLITIDVAALNKSGSLPPPFYKIDIEDKREDYKPFYNREIPVLHLDDPLEYAQRLADDLFEQVNDLYAVQAEAMADPKYIMARSFQQIILHDEELAEQVDRDEVERVLHWKDHTTVLDRIERHAKRLGDYLLRTDGVTIHAVIDDFLTRNDNVSLDSLEFASCIMQYLALTDDGAQTIASLLKNNDSFISKCLATDFAQKAVNVKEYAGHAAKFVGAMAELATSMPDVKDKVFAFLQVVVRTTTSGQYTLVISDTNLASLLTGQAPVTRGSGLRHHFVWEHTVHISASLWLIAPASGAQAVPSGIGRSLEWLKQNQPLIQKKLIGLSSVLETINLLQAINSQRQNDSTEAKIKIAGSMISLTGLYLEYLKDIRKVAEDWDKVPSAFAREPTRLKRVAIVVGAHGAAFVGNTIALNMGFRDALKAWQQGRRDAATALAVSALGNTAMTIAGVMQGAIELQQVRNASIGAGVVSRLAKAGSAEVATTRLGLGLTVVRLTNFIGWATLIIGFTWSIFTATTPLEEWLFHGPFGRRIDKRYLSAAEGGSDEWASWHDDAVAENALQNLLFGFGLAYRYGASRNALRKQGIWLRIRATMPQFAPNKSVLHHELNNYRFQYDERMRATGDESRLEVGEPSTYKVIAGKEGLTEVHIEYPFVPYTGVGRLEAQLQLDLNGDGKMRIPATVTRTNDVTPIPSAGLALLKMKLLDARTVQDELDSGWIS